MAVQRHRDGLSAGEDRSCRSIGSVRIALADDHHLVRRGLQLVLDRVPDFEVVVEAADIDSARSCVLSVRPDVLVLDLHMPGGSAIDLIAELRVAVPQTQIVVLTMEQDVGFANAVIGAGALAYVLKDAADDELVQAVRQAVAGEGFVNPVIAAKLDSCTSSQPPDDLTRRELEVLRRIALGHTNREIAKQLFLSIRTVEAHRGHIQEKLRLTGRAQLSAYARWRGLLPPPAASWTLRT
jgi:two-component system, NarL family, response regulator NreC